jgi:hypothetical protein
MPLTPLIDELERINRHLREVRDYLIVAILVCTLLICGLMLALSSLFLGTV